MSPYRSAKSHLNLIAELRSGEHIHKGFRVWHHDQSVAKIQREILQCFRQGPQREVREKFRLQGKLGRGRQAAFILNPIPSAELQGHTDLQSTDSDDGNAYYAYYIMPATIEYNPDLVWQRNHQGARMEINLAGTRISLAGYWNKTAKAFSMNKAYEAFTYNTPIRKRFVDRRFR